MGRQTAGCPPTLHQELPRPRNDRPGLGRQSEIAAAPKPPAILTPTAAIREEAARSSSTQEIGIPLKDFKDINKQMSTGEAKARQAKK